jgi:MFS family permease
VRALLGRREFRALLAGQTISALGDWMATVAMLVLVFELTGSSTAVGGVLVLQLLPAAVTGPLATRLVRRWNRRRTMLGADLVRVAIAVLIPLVGALWWVYLWAFVLQVGGLVFLPARDASIPELAGEENLPLANALILGSSYGTIPLGAAAFGGVSWLQTAVFGHGGPIGGRPFLFVFLIDAATFLVSFAFVRPLRILDELPKTTEARKETEWPASLGSAPETEGGFLAAFRIPLVRAVLPATTTVSLGIGTLFSVGVVFVQKVLHASDSEFGALIALFGAGAAIGLGLLQLTGRRDQLWVARVTVMIQGATIVLISLAPDLVAAYLGALAFGASTSATLVAGMSVLQARLNGQERVQAFAVFHILIRTALSLAALGAGAAVDLVGAVNWPFLGRLEPARVVLLVSGLLVLASSTWVREERPRRRETQP